ncbi:MAG TPA: peptide ABC transporter substrate-binding protein [Myxococcota bacterium]|nr:peptide ABC transporter substrate-binding protein [Myxococcota bacterium]
MPRASRSRATRRVLLLALGVLILAGALALGRGASLERADCAFVNGAEPATLDPAAITAIPEGRIVRALFEGLVVRDPATLEPRPGVAESWEVSPDGLLWTFHLRQGAVWTDGERVTARDFAFSFERLLDPRTAAGYASQLYCVEGARAFATEVDERGAPRRSFDTVAIRAEDPSTLTVRLEHPFAPFLDVLACPQLAPVSERQLAAMRERFPSTWTVEWLRPEHLVTNGPFRLLERRANDRIRLGRFAGYWDAAHVAMETIDALAVEHASTALNLYLTGEVAWVDQVPADLADRLSKREDFRSAAFLGTYFYRVNVSRAPFDDPRVRRALALAIDREAIVRKVTRCGEQPLYACVPPGFGSFAGAPMRHAASFAEDVEEARKLLKECGRTLPPIAIHYNTRELNRDVAEVIADSWRRNLGVSARLENQEWRVFLDTQKKIAYDVSRSSWIADYADPFGFLEIFTSGNENNRTGWGDARYDELLRRAAAALEPERSELLREAESILMEALPILPIYAYASKNLVDPRLQGFFENALDEHPPKAWSWKQP